jgi:dsDNA-specific endonuclease/ATPase MutS2
MGLPADVLARAEELTPEQARTLDAMLAELERREAELGRREDEVADTQARLTRESSAAESERSELEQRLTAIGERERELEREGREQVRRFLLEARKRVEEALGTARAAVSEATAKEARRLVEEGVQEEADALRKLEDSGWRVKGRTKNTSPGAKRQGAVEADASLEQSVPGSAFTVPSDTEVSSELNLRGMPSSTAKGPACCAAWCRSC